MKQFIDKLIGRLEEEKRRLRSLKNDCISLCDREVIEIEEKAYNFCKEIVNQLAEEYKHCALCYLGSPCEYQNAESSCEKCEEYNNKKHYCPKFCYVIENAVKELKEHNNGWIPFTQRELTEEEKEEMNTDFDYMLDCKLPDDNQEIIVSYKNGYIDTDTFFNDCGECYLDSGNDFIDDAVAWMPLPAPYQPKGE